MKEKIIDEIVNQKNILTKNLSEDEKKEIDIYLEELLQDLSPAMKIFKNLKTNEEFRKSVTESFKSEIEEQKWLERLSKTFYNQVSIQDQMKTQKE